MLEKWKPETLTWLGCLWDGRQTTSTVRLFEDYVPGTGIYQKQMIIIVDPRLNIGNQSREALFQRPKAFPFSIAREVGTSTNHIPVHNIEHTAVRVIIII